MKKSANLFLYLLLFLLAFSCNEKEEEFNIYSYNGAYPRNKDGSVIKTYTPEIIGGEIDAQFNGHPWNHTPYLGVSVTEWNPPRVSENEQTIDLLINSYLTYGHIMPCLLESFSFRTPLKEGVVFVNESIGLQYETARFLTINCDAGKDKYKLDKKKNNTISIVSYDKNTRELRAEFDVSFVIKDRNSDFGPIYPKHVHIKGKIKTVATKE